MTHEKGCGAAILADIVSELLFAGHAAASGIGFCDPSGEYRSHFEWFVDWGSAKLGSPTISSTAVALLNGEPDRAIQFLRDRLFLRREEAEEVVARIESGQSGDLFELIRQAQRGFGADGQQ